MLIELAPDLWIHRQAWMGMTHALCTTLVRLRDGRLWVHSPTELDPALRREVEALGDVGYLVAANNHHHRWLPQWATAFPAAELFVSRDVPRKRPELKHYTRLAPDAPRAWRDDLQQAFMAGVPVFDETVFLHTRSGSLIVTDLVQNHTDPAPIGWAARLAVPIFAQLGFRGVCPAPPLRLRSLRRDPPAFQRFLETIAAWPVQRIIVTHGRIIEENASAHLIEVCATLSTSRATA